MFLLMVLPSILCSTYRNISLWKVGLIPCFFFFWFGIDIMLWIFLQIPVSKVQTYGDLRNVLMKRIFLSALHFRINTRYKVCACYIIF
jgi:hypothetical protein